MVYMTSSSNVNTWLITIFLYVPIRKCFFPVHRQAKESGYVKLCLFTFFCAFFLLWFSSWFFFYFQFAFKQTIYLINIFCYSVSSDKLSNTLSLFSIPEPYTFGQSDVLSSSPI